MSFDIVKPAVQFIGDGFLLWQWHVGDAVIESLLSVRDGNPTGFSPDEYVV